MLLEIFEKIKFLEERIIYGIEKYNYFTLRRTLSFENCEISRVLQNGES